MSLRDQLRALVRLAEIDAAAREIDKELNDIPEKMDERRRDVARLETLLGREREQLDAAAKMREGHDAEIQRLADLLAKSKAKSARVRNQREAEAVEKELEDARRNTREREAERAKLAEAIESQKKAFEAHAEEFEKLRAMVAEEDAQAQVRKSELDAKRSQVVAGRDEVAAKVDKMVVRRYDTVRDRRGSGVSEVKENICTSCRLAIQPQLALKLNTLTLDELAQCPHCQRFLYVAAAIVD